MATSSITVTSQPTLVYSGGLKDALIQNNATGSNVFFSDTPNLTSSSYSIQLLPGTPLEWPAGSPLWAICAPGSSSTVTVLDNGASMGVSVSALQSAINALITVTQSVANPQPFFVTAITPYQLYDLVGLNLSSGTYTFSCISTTVATIDIYDTSQNYIATAVTVSGTVTMNIAVSIGALKFYTNTGSNILIEIIRTGASVGVVSGTYAAYTTTTLIPALGDAYVVLYGGGGGGGGGSTSTIGGGGGGGGTGGVVAGRINISTPTTVTVGIGGNGGVSGSPGIAGGNTTFAGLTGLGGNGGTNGTTGTSGGAGGVAVSGGIGGGAGANAVSGGGNAPVAGTTGANAQTLYPFFPSVSPGSGGGGAADATQPTGAVGGTATGALGNGGSGGNSNLPGGVGGLAGGGGGGKQASGGKGGNGFILIIY